MGMSTLSAATSAFTVSMLSAGGQSMRITSKASRLGWSAWRSLISRPIGSVSRRTSAAVRSWLAGSSMKPPSATGTSAAARSDSPSSTSQVLRWSVPLSTPLPMVALPCGSRSISSTRRRVAASDAARLTAVVVLPTPPFWFAMAMTRFMGDSVLHRRARAGGAGFSTRQARAGTRLRCSGHQFVALPGQQLTRHLVRHRVRRAILAPGAFEDFRQSRGNALDLGNDLLFGSAAVILARDADDAAGIDHVVRAVEDPGRLQRLNVLSLRQLVVRGSGDDARAQARDRLHIEHRSQRTRGQHVDVLGQHVLDRHGSCPELRAHPLHGGRTHVGNAQLRALGSQQPAKVVAHTTHALYGDGEVLQIRPAEPESDRGLDPQIDTERGLRPRVPARLARRAPEARHIARHARHAGHVDDRRADVFGRDVASAERVNEAAEGLEQLRCLCLARLADDDGLAAAERHAGQRILVAHATRQAQDIGNRLRAGGVRPHAAAAGRRAPRGGMNGDDRAQPGRGVVPEDDQLVAVEFAHVEDFHRVRAPGAKARERIVSRLPPSICTAHHKSCFSGAICEISIALFRQYARRIMHPDLDRGDLRILDLVQEHGHLSAADVAERLGMTASTCCRRISRLEELGVIRKRVALLDREKLGLPVMVFSHVKLAGHGRDALLRFEQAVRAHPEILECYTLMGETDFLLRIVCRDIKAYEAFFLDHLSRFPGVQSVNSSIALAVIKETTALPLQL